MDFLGLQPPVDPASEPIQCRPGRLGSQFSD
jgi:hypothetical protein